jgi:uncharacterized protein YbaR (Trm112 family)
MAHPYYICKFCGEEYHIDDGVRGLYSTDYCCVECRTNAGH